MDPLRLLDCNMREAKVLNDEIAVLVNVSSITSLLGNGEDSHVVRITRICPSCHSDLTLMLGPRDQCLCGAEGLYPSTKPLSAVYTGQLDGLDFEDFFARTTNPLDALFYSLDLRELVLKWKR